MEKNQEKKNNSMPSVQYEEQTNPQGKHFKEKGNGIPGRETL